MGCAGGIDNGINTVHLAYVRAGAGHTLIGARQARLATAYTQLS